eukprot:8714867-Alexandrium_andersonii.AAC.1
MSRQQHSGSPPVVTEFRYAAKCRAPASHARNVGFLHLGGCMCYHRSERSHPRVIACDRRGGL